MFLFKVVALPIWKANCRNKSTILQRIESMLKNLMAVGALALVAACSSVPGSAGINAEPKQRVSYVVDGQSGVDKAEAERRLLESVSKQLTNADGTALQIPVKLIRGQMPQYPLGSLISHSDGKVMVQFTVLESGDVANVHILKSGQNNLNTAVVAAVQNWKFTPYVKDGIATTFVAQKQFVFRVE
jgi:TonB family protein